MGYNRLRKLNLYYAAVFALLLLSIPVTVFFVHSSYQDAVRLIKKQFHNQQDITARQAALAIESNFKDLELELERLALDPAVRSFDYVETRKEMQRTYTYVKRLYVNDISRADARGIVRITLHSPELLGRDFSWRQYFKTLKAENSSFAYEFITFQGLKKGQKGIILAKSVLSENGRFRGPVLFVIDISDMIKGYLDVLPGGLKGWVIDHNGVVLFHPDYPGGITVEQFPGTDESFKQFITKAMNADVGRAEYPAPDGGSGMVMASSHSFTVAGERFSVVLESFQNDLAGYLQSYSIRYFIGVFFSFTIIAGGLLFVIYLTRKSMFAHRQEIAERRMAEYRVHESEQRFGALIEYSPMGTIIVDSDETIVYINRRLTKILGYTIDMIPTTKQWFSSAYPDPEYREKMIHRWKKFLSRAGSTTTEMRPSEYSVTDARGNVHIMEIQGAIIGDKKMIIFNDVTEKKKLEQQLLHTQKMECFGRLAGGVAHDFNNIIAVILGYGEIIQDELGSDNPLKTKVDMIVQAANSATRLTSSLLAMSRKQVLNPQPCDLNEIINRMQSLLRRLISANISMEVQLSPEPLPVIVDYGQIEQVLMNLTTNSRDSMPDGGTIRITTETVMLESDFITRFGYGKKGGYAVMTFSDTGSGMDVSVQEKIFEPFFTTKEAGKGTGLGLSIVYGIIRQHDGYIDISSTPGSGTTFIIYLSLMQALAHRENEERHAEAEHLDGNECILLVEDNEPLRNALQKILEDSGYQVVIAADGEEALRVFSGKSHEIDLLLSDMVLPGIGGKELYQKITNARPDIKTLFISGYSPDLVYDEDFFQAPVTFISKPFTTRRLRRKIREVLDS